MLIRENCLRVAIKTVLYTRGVHFKMVNDMTNEIIAKAVHYQRLTDQSMAMIDEDVSLIRRALDHAGYTHVDDTEENLIDCFKDYVDSGIWADLTLDDIDGITTEEMCRALLNIKCR